MGEYAFGGPRGGIIQTAFVVKDIKEAIASWIADCRVGPWFLLDHFSGEHPVYRGGPSTADVAIAMAFAGHMQIELIQPNDANPSVYKETIDARGYGFHHLGRASDDVDADLAALERDGYQAAFRAGVPTGGDVVYLEKAGNSGFLELIPATAGMEAAFTRFWQASVGWDGTDPIRPFP
ncbi:MAG: VOC family protein [Sphingomonadaceae bacterium]|nr:VOC family protein [Sphingomonadaceae bacterium]